MSVRFLAALAALGLLISSTFAEKKKSDNAPETGPAPRTIDAQQILPPPVLPPQPALPVLRQVDYQIELPGTLKSADVATAPQVLKTYAVADLVVPLPVVGAPPTAAPKTLEADLIRKITATVEPKSWSAAGGKGTIDYFANGMALVVNTTADVHVALAKYLDTVRQIQDRQVVSEIRLITVSDEWFKQSGLARGFTATKDAEKPAPKFYTNSEFVAMMQSVQQDSEANVIQAPRLTCLNGQAGRIRAGETAHFLTGFTMKSDNGKLVYVPKNEAHELGVDITVEPTVSADNKSIKLAVNGSFREHGILPVPTTSVTMLLPPTPESGKQAEPAPFTHLLQEPRIVTRTVADTVMVPDGGTVLLYGGKATIQGVAKETPPSLKSIPYLDALFTSERKTTTTNHLLVVVTSRIIRESEMEECVQCAAGSGKLPKLLHEYGRACKEGRVDEARRLAIECLAIDPTCFMQK